MVAAVARVARRRLNGCLMMSRPSTVSPLIVASMVSELRFRLSGDRADAVGLDLEIGRADRLWAGWRI